MQNPTNRDNTWTIEQVELVDQVARGGLTRRGFLVRAAAAGMAAATASSVLAACSGAAPDAGQAGKNAQGYEAGSADLKVQLGQEISGPHYPDPWRGPRARTIEKFGDGTTEFTVLTRDDPNLNLSTNAFSKYLEDLTGVKVKYQTVPMGDEGTPKVNAIIASGEMPDAFMLGPEWMGGFTRSQIYIYGQQGLFQPLDQLVDEYAPQLQEFFTMIPELRSYMTTPDGTMYGFPGVNDCYHCKSAGTRAWINQAWLDKVGLKMPKTSDELRTTLKAFKAENPAGLSGSVPFSTSKDQWAIGYFLQSFLNTPFNWLARNNDETVFTPTQSGFRDALRYVAELVREGVFDPNSFTQTGDQLKRRVMNKPGSLVGMTIGNQPPVFMDVDYSDPHARWQDYKNLPPVAGPSGRAYVAWDYSPPGGAGLVISKSCKDPKTMVRWADAMLGLIPTLNQQTGPQGKFWGWAKPGAKGIDGRSAVYQLMPNEAKNAGWNQWGPFAYSLDVRNANAVTGATMEPLIYAAGKASEPFASPKNEYFLAPYFDADQAAQIGEVTTNLQNHYTQATTRFCLGQDDIDSDAAWNSYVSKYDQLGLEQYLKINTEAMKANK